jgi:hypothetical protein
MVLATAPVARAEMTLEWEAPPSCPQRGEVLDRIRALAGSSVEKTDGLSVEGSIERAGNRYSLKLLVRDGREVRKRVITSESCADLAGAAAVTLALLLGIDVSSEGLTEDGSPQTETTPGAAGTTTDGQNKPSDQRTDQGGKRANQRLAESTRETRSETPDASPSGRRWAVVLRAPAATADLGPLPHPALGLGLGVGVRYGSWRAVLSGHVSQKQTVNAPEPNDTSGAELERLTAELSGCYGFRSRDVEIAPCLALALEHVTARGFGEGVAPQSARAAWPALGAGVAAHWYPAKFLAIFVTFTGYVELSRPRLVIEGLGDVAELEPAAAGAAVGAEWTF